MGVYQNSKNGRKFDTIVAKECVNSRVVWVFIKIPRMGENLILVAKECVYNSATVRKLLQ